MGYHNLLTGQDLHEPSRVRVINNILISGQTVSLIPGDLVKLGKTTTFNVLDITAYAEENDTQIAYVDTVIGGGDEGTVVLIGKVLSVPISSTSLFATGDLLKVGSAHRFVSTIALDGLVGNVLYRSSSNSATMQIIFNPTSSVPHHPTAAVYLQEPVFTPRVLTAAIPVAASSGSTGRFIIGWNSFGIGLDSTSGNGSFSFTTEQIPGTSNLGSKDSIDILEDGTYEISLDPYIHFAGTGTPASGSFSLSSVNNNAITYTITNTITLEILRVDQTVETLFTNTAPTSVEGTKIIRIGGGGPSVTFPSTWPTLVGDLGFNLDTLGAYPKIVGLKAGDKISLGMNISLSTVVVVSLGDTITFEYTPVMTTDPATARSKTFTCGIRFKRLF